MMGDPQGELNDRIASLSGADGNQLLLTMIQGALDFDLYEDDESKRVAAVDVLAGCAHFGVSGHIEAAPKPVSWRKMCATIMAYSWQMVASLACRWIDCGQALDLPACVPVKPPQNPNQEEFCD